MAHVHPATPKSVTRLFSTRLINAHWLLTMIKIKFSDFGDSIDGGCILIYGVHTATEARATAIMLPEPPASHPRPMEEFIYSPFNCTEYV